MNNFTLFLCGIIVTGVAGMGIITSEVFLGYAKFVESTKRKKEFIKDEEELIKEFK